MSERPAEPEQLGTMTVVFTDMEGSTALRQRVGEKRFSDMLAAYEALLRECVAAHGGLEEKAVGDGHMLAFPGARGALRYAVALQRALSADDALPFEVRMGLHSGDVERQGTEMRGRVLAKAARISAQARGGEILVSRVVRELAGLDESSEIWFDEGREVELRGLRGRHELLPVRWENQPRPRERIVVADDAAMVREGVAALLREHGMEVVATVGDAESLQEAVARHRPDVALVDIRMPPTYTNEGLVAAELIRQAYPAVGLLVLSQHVEPSYAVRLIQDGEQRSGYLLKDRISEVEVLLDAVRRVARGGCVVDSSLAASMLDQADARGSLEELSEREREVLGLLAQGLSNRAIAERLVVTGRTVETHVGQIFLKLGLRDAGVEHRRVAAVLTYLRAREEG